MSQSHVLVICAKRYNGHELWTLLGVLRRRGHSFEVVSQDTTIRDELTLRPNTIKRTVWEVPADSAPTLFNGIIVVSGNMLDTEAYWTDSKVQTLLHAFKEAKSTVAAICCSVPTLAPVAKGARVSFYPLVRSRQRLQKFGAILTTVSLTVDMAHKLITAENQMLSELWAEEICNNLEGKEPVTHLVDSGFSPKGSPRILHASIQDAIDSSRAARGLKPLPPAPTKEELAQGIRSTNRYAKAFKPNFDS